MHALVRIILPAGAVLSLLLAWPGRAGAAGDEPQPSIEEMLDACTRVRPERATGADHAGVRNVLENGSFETGDLARWRTKAGEAAPPRIERRPLATHGRYAASLGASSWMESSALRLHAGRDYTLAFRVMFRGPTNPGLRAGLRVDGAVLAETGISGADLDPPTARSAEWLAVRLPFLARPGNATVFFSGSGGGGRSGRAFVDDVRVAELRLDGRVPAVVFLDDLPAREVTVGYGELGLHGQAGYEGMRVRLNGLPTSHALSMHPPTNGRSKATFDLGGRFEVFRAAVILNDSRPACSTPIVFRVVADGRKLWASRPVRRRGRPQSFHLGVRGARTLTLIVDCPGSYVNAHAAWWEPRVLKPGERR